MLFVKKSMNSVDYMPLEDELIDNHFLLVETFWHVFATATTSKQIIDFQILFPWAKEVSIALNEIELSAERERKSDF